MLPVGTRDRLMTFTGESISTKAPSAEPAVQRSPDSGNPAAADIAGLINTHPLSTFQKEIMVLIGTVILMDHPGDGVCRARLDAGLAHRPKRSRPDLWRRAPWYVGRFDAAQHSFRSCRPTARARRIDDLLQPVHAGDSCGGIRAATCVPALLDGTRHRRADGEFCLPPPCIP